MACGCMVVGFAGLGGWDYMRQAQGFTDEGVSWLPLRETPWEGNGLWAADGDVLAAAMALEQAIRWRATGDSRLGRVLDNAALTASWYSPERQRHEITTAWRRIEES